MRQSAFVFKATCSSAPFLKGCRLLTFVSLLMLNAESGPAQQPQPSEYQLKAAFLYHFAQFTEWPAPAYSREDSPFVIGVLGEDPFGPALQQTLLGKTLAKHPVTYKLVRSVAEATNSCHMLFVSSSEKKHLPQIITELNSSSVLTVGESDEFIASGGMINFVMQGNKIRFQINNAAAKAAGLQIRSKLLSLALPPPG